MSSSSINGMSSINGINAIDRVNEMSVISKIPRVASMTNLSGYPTKIETVDPNERVEEDGRIQQGALFISKGKVADFIKEHGATILGLVAALVGMGLLMTPMFFAISNAAFVIAAATFGGVLVITGIVGLVLDGCGYKMADP